MFIQEQNFIGPKKQNDPIVSKQTIKHIHQFIYSLFGLFNDDGQTCFYSYYIQLNSYATFLESYII